MKNPAGKTIEAFVTALSSIVYNATPIPVYSIPPDGELGNYIVVREPTNTELGCKIIIGHDATIQVDIITAFQGNFGTPLPAEEITDLVTEAIKPNPGHVLTVENFEMITLTLGNSIPDSNLFGDNRSYRRVLTWNFIIDEDNVPVWILELGNWNDGGIWDDNDVWKDGP